MPTPTTIKTGLDPEWPLSFAPADNGSLYGMNGIDVPLRWNGQDSATKAMGVPFPQTALTLTGVTTATTTSLVTSAGGLQPRGLAIDLVNSRMYATYQHASWNRVRGGALTGSGWADILTGAGTPDGIAVDGSAGLIYFIAAGSGLLRRMTTAGGSLTTLVSGLTGARSVAIDRDNGYLFYITDTGNTIKRCNLNGGDNTTVVTGVGTGYGIALDTAKQQFFYCTLSGFVGRYNYDGTDPTNVVTAAGVQLVYLALDLTDGRIYMTSGNSQSVIYRCNLDGTNFESWITGLSGPYGIQVDQPNGHLYIAAYDANEIQRVSLRPITGRYVAYQRWLDADGNPSSLSPVSNEVQVYGASGFSYTAVPVPTDAVVTRRQILRNTSAQELLFYVDIDTTDLVATSFSSTLNDTQLQEEEAVSIVDSAGNSLTNRFNEPPEDRPILTYFNGRLFATGDVIYEGSATFTNGSPTVTGVGTNFTSQFVGRFMRPKGVNAPIEVSAVGGVTTLTLLSNFTGTTGIYEFEIRAAPATRNTLYWSEAGEYHGWDPANGINVGDPGEENRALIAASSFLYVMQRRSTYRFTYQSDPRQGNLFLEYRRGVINHRCWAQAGNDTYLMDDLGIYRLRGGAPDDDFSGRVQFLFRRRTGDNLPRIDWGRARFFHCVVDQADETVRWYVSLAHTLFPQAAIIYRYGADEWAIEEYPYPIAHSAVLPVAPNVVAVGSNQNKVYGLAANTLEVAASSIGSRFRATAVDWLNMTFDPALYALPSNLVGAPIVVARGRGKGQRRLIVAATSTTITVNDIWTIVPDTTSEFQIGGIQWNWKSREMRWRSEDRASAQRIHMNFRPGRGSFDLRLYEDYGLTPALWGADYPNHPTESDGVQYRRGSPDAEVNSATADGYAVVDISRPLSKRSPSGDLVQLELRGVGSIDPLRINSLIVEGVTEGEEVRR